MSSLWFVNREGSSAVVGSFVSAEQYYDDEDLYDYDYLNQGRYAAASSAGK